MKTIVPKKLKAVSRATVNELRDIIAKVEADKYDLNQGIWHCGSSHCVAGFKEIRDLNRNRTQLLDIIDPEFRESTKAQIKKLVMPAYHSVRDKIGQFRAIKLRETFADYPHGGDTTTTTMMYAQYMWGLTIAEANDLFSGSNDIDLIKEITDKLEEGLRKVNGQKIYAFWVNPENVSMSMTELQNEFFGTGFMDLNLPDEDDGESGAI